MIPSRLTRARQIGRSHRREADTTVSQAPSSTLQPFPASSAQGHQARHLLALPGDVEIDEVETLAVSRFAGARWDVAPSGTDPLTPAPRTAKPGEPFILHPGEFVLGATYEQVSLPDDVAARLEGKSSLGRLGLLTHSTAGFIDPGFSGHVTLELSNVATLPITLWPGMKIGQLCFFRLSSASEHPYGSSIYGSRYQGQRGPTASRSWQNFHRTDV